MRVNTAHSESLSHKQNATYATDLATDEGTWLNDMAEVMEVALAL